MARALGEHLAQLLLGLVTAPLRQRRLGLIEPLLLAAQLRDVLEPRACAVVGRVVALGALVGGLRLIELLRVAGGIALPDELVELHLALAHGKQPVLGVARVECERLVDLRQAFFGLALLDQLLAAAHQFAAGRARRQQPDHGERCAKQPHGACDQASRRAHGVFPSTSTWVSFSGR